MSGIINPELFQSFPARLEKYNRAAGLHYAQRLAENAATLLLIDMVEDAKKEHRRELTAPE
jgi:hypothetical protein